MNSKIVVSNFEVKSIKEEDSEYFTVEGYASVYGNIDSYRDIVEKGAFSLDLMENGNERPILWQHNSSQPIGVGVFSESDQGLKVSCRLPKESEFVKKEVMPMVKCGAVKGMSIGYSVVTEEYDRVNNINYLKVLKLRETSVCTFPANEMAQITAAKQILESSNNTQSVKNFPMGSDKDKWDESQAVSDIKEITKSEAFPSSEYKDCFMFCQKDKPNDHDGYHLPFVKSVNGELRVMPEAVFSIAGKMASDMLDVSIPETEKESIKEKINFFYKKLGKEEPFKGKKTFVDPNTLKNMESIDRLFGDPDYIISSKAKKLIQESVRCHLGGSLKQDSVDLLATLKRANEEMENISYE